MYFVIDVQSHINRDANGMYTVELCGNDFYVTLGDIAEFLEVKEYEITVVRIFSSFHPDDTSMMYPTIYVTDDEIFFS